MRRLAKFLRLSASEKIFLIEAAVGLAFARLALAALPFRWIAPLLDDHGTQPRPKTEIQDAGVAERVRWAVQTANWHLPWQSTCLAEAIVGKLMLKRRRVGSTLCLGVAKDEDHKPAYHAWLRSGDTVVAGDHMNESYTVIATFGQAEQ